jgi:hypothetical protein
MKTIKEKPLTGAERAIISDALYIWAGTFDNLRTSNAIFRRAERFDHATESPSDISKARFALGQLFQEESDFDNAEQSAAVNRFLAS